MFHHFDATDPPILSIPRRQLTFNFYPSDFVLLTHLQFTIPKQVVAVSISSQRRSRSRRRRRSYVCRGIGFDSGSDLVVVNEVGWPCRAPVSACQSNQLLPAPPPPPPTRSWSVATSRRDTRRSWQSSVILLYYYFWPLSQSAVRPKRFCSSNPICVKLAKRAQKCRCSKLKR